MSDTLTIATNGLNSAGTRIAKAATNIVNASSTGDDHGLSTAATNLIRDKTTYAAEAKVIRAVQQDNKTLVDILA